MRRRVCRKVDTTKPSLVKMWILKPHEKHFRSLPEALADLDLHGFLKMIGTRVKQLLLALYKCHLRITFTNSLDPDQAWQYFGPGQDPNCLTLMVFLKEILQKS